MNGTCTCGQRFLDAEDFRDHMPCPGTRAEQWQARAEKAEAREDKITKAADHLRSFLNARADGYRGDLADIEKALALLSPGAAKDGG